MISVLTTVYNARSGDLRQAIESILNQTYENFEFIIINDASTNDTEDVILSYKDKRIKYFKNKKNLHIIASANKGLDLCSGKYIARLDSDDYSAPERLERQVEYMEEHPNIGGLGTSFKRLHTGEEVHFSENSDDIKLLTRYVMGCIRHSSSMMRRSVLLENNLKYDKNCIYAEDFKFWSDMSYYADLAVLPEVLTFIRCHEDGVSRTNQKWQDKMVKVVLLDNMIKDFDCDKTYLYSILAKYVKSQPLTRKEFEDFKTHLEKVITYVALRVNFPHNYTVKPYILSMLAGIPVQNNN